MNAKVKAHEFIKIAYISHNLVIENSYHSIDNFTTVNQKICIIIIAVLNDSTVIALISLYCKKKISGFRIINT